MCERCKKARGRDRSLTMLHIDGNVISYELGAFRLCDSCYAAGQAAEPIANLFGFLRPAPKRRSSSLRPSRSVSPELRIARFLEDT